MLSRIAESLFWMNRYVERAEGMLRMLKINYVTSLDKNEKENYNWTPVLQIFTSLDDHEIDKIKDSSQYTLSHRQESLKRSITKT